MKNVVFYLLLSSSLLAQKNPPSMVDFDTFMETTREVQAYRAERLISIDTFNQYAREAKTIILDTRPFHNYSRKHMAGAIHLNFSDFSEEKLKKIIPDKSYRILIYCNNNFTGDPLDFVGKLPPMALNIPTFINLYGYGYKNVYELQDLLPVDHPNVVFAGSQVVRMVR